MATGCSNTQFGLRSMNDQEERDQLERQVSVPSVSRQT